SLVRTEWNAVSANVLFDPRRAFAWGGSCAVRRDHLRVLRLEDRWREVLSDDLVLSQAVRDAGLKIAYAPAALVPTFEGATQIWSLVRTEWNAVSANVLFDPRRAFAWGSSCAVRRDHLRVLRLEDRWREVLSDDLVLSQAVRDAGLKIAYAPAALVPTFEGATRAICLEWCVRQMMMATLYLPIVRRYAAASFAVFDGSVILGLASLSLASALGPSYLVPAILFLAPLLVAVVKAFVRRRALFSAAPSVATAWKVPPWRVAFAALAVPWVMAWGLVRTRRPTSVRWRGHVYDVRDPQRIRLLDPRRGPNPDSKDPSG